MNMGSTASDLSALLLTGAQGNYSDEAAVGLLVGHGMWLTRSAFVRACVTVEDGVGADSGPMAFVDWHVAIRALDGGELPCSTSEASILRIAAGIGGVPVDLRVMLGGLDAENVLLVAKAVMHANGTPIATLPSLPPSASDVERPEITSASFQTSALPEGGHRG
ncbi:hypothetical protein [Actinomadura xylanilytica]|uniref:hypothetical protein n=1 Tax=Actinomadura xylanilytica TaxID=887459 RepID=UPI00255B3893|nr:hypothetical protein [Actinomadura xylanilytica]MDL4777595.1 hypothetical protein [Actinomadura xylanilytica]